MGYSGKYYDKKTLTEKVWHNSSMIKYSEMVENPSENYGDLTVVFNNGSTYRYKNVSLGDYVFMVSGGLSGSNGKTFNDIIKKHGYEYEKIAPLSQEYIEEGYQEFMERERAKEITYFVSGHRDITEDEFERNYKPALESIVNEVPDCRFVIGDYYGVDIMAQNYLIDVLGVEPDRITIYHMFEAPRNIHPKIKNIIGGFESDAERDAAMTAASVDDIAFVRDNTKISGTAENILRRHMLI
jgi:hypothetical protein